MQIQNAAATEVMPCPEAETDTENELAPRFQIILFDDDDHTYPYVIEMMEELFDLSDQDAYQVAYDVDFLGQAVVKTCSYEQACSGRDRILTYGADHRLEHSNSSMKATIQEVGK
ncbi:hypothetical protein BH09SUM1_BH09SUM1_30340 [soil metagenome]